MKCGNGCAFLQEVGLGYVTLNRSADLSVGSATGTIGGSTLRPLERCPFYVLDEPTIGLHPSENRMLLDALEALVQRGNTVWWWSTMKIRFAGPTT